MIRAHLTSWRHRPSSGLLTAKCALEGPLVTLTIDSLVDRVRYGTIRSDLSGIRLGGWPEADTATAPLPSPVWSGGAFDFTVTSIHWPAVYVPPQRSARGRTGGPRTAPPCSSEPSTATTTPHALPRSEPCDPAYSTTSSSASTDGPMASAIRSPATS